MRPATHMLPAQFVAAARWRYSSTVPGPVTVLDGSGDPQHGVLAPPPADDLQPDRQPGVLGAACWPHGTDSAGHGETRLNTAVMSGEW